MLRQGKGFPRLARWIVWTALWLATATRAQPLAFAEDISGDRVAHRMSGRLPGKPATLWLWYANGSPLPENPPACGDVNKPPPAFKCNYGSSVDDCQRQVQAYLDAWYADFNLVFSLTRPSNGDYYAMMITSDGSWCPSTSTSTTTEAGVANVNCNDNPGTAALAFACGYSAHACATVIAHEHGHMVGLEHTISTTDVMHDTVLPTASGFEDNKDNRILDDTFNICNLTKQDSYQQMLAALGPWPGGPKPGPFAAQPDAAAPDAPPSVDTDASSGSGSVGPAPSAGDGGVLVVASDDAQGLVRPPLPTVDSSTHGPSSGHGGCSLTPSRSALPPSGTLLLVVLFLLARWRGLAAGLATGFARISARARGAPARRP